MNKRNIPLHKINRRLRNPEDIANILVWGNKVTTKKVNTTKTVTSSRYSAQLKAKQKIRLFYGNVKEKQFNTLYQKASMLKGNILDNFPSYLEQRLATVMYRANFANTIFHARQLINHGHVEVNNQKVTIPSYQIKENDVISITNKSKEYITTSCKHINDTNNTPNYLQVNRADLKIVFLKKPKLSEIIYPVKMEFQLITELYSK